MRELIISECMNLLSNYKFTVSQSFSRSCFDILARKKDLKFLIKVLKNIDSLSVEQSRELMKISGILNAIPLLIGVRTRNLPMENDVVYERHGIKAITYETFKLYLEGSPPVVYAGRGGFFVNIDGETLRNIREKLNISAGELAEYSNVSRKTIYKYEQNMANPSIEVALKIEQYLDVPLVKEIDLMPEELKERNNINLIQDQYTYTDVDIGNEFKLQVINMLNELGFNMIETKRAPFDAVAEKYEEYATYEEEHCTNTILLTNIEETETEETRKKALILNQISRILNSYSLVVLEKNTKNIGHIKTISLKELEKMDDAFDLLEYLISKTK
jgi:putative transcriptional regulator